MLDADEREIYYYVKAREGEFVAAGEICRRASGRKRYQYRPDWALPVLMRMIERGILESDTRGYYRLKPIPKPETKGKRWLSPQLAGLFNEKGRWFDNLITIEEDLTYYDKL